MVKARYISLLTLVIAFAFGGCNPGIVEPPPVTVTDASAYFFPSPNPTDAPIVFEDSNITSLTGTTITLKFDQRNAANSFFIHQNGTDSLNCTLSNDAVIISGITAHSIIPLPSNFSIQSKRDSTIISVPLPIHHIIATSRIVVVSNDSLGVYYSTNIGQQWNHVSGTTFGRSNYVKAFALYGDMIFAGTSSGGLYYTSVSDGSSWTEAPKAPISNGIVALASSTSALYFTDGSHIYRSQNPTNSTPDLLSPSLSSYNISSLAVSDSTLKRPEIIVAGTNAGLFYRSIDSDWSRTSLGDKNVREIIATPKGNFYCSTLNDSLSAGIYSSLDGFFWTQRDTLKYAMLGFDGSVIIAATPSGVVDKIPDNSTSATNLISLQTNINDLSVSGNNYFAATNQGVYVSTDNGKQWTQFSNGISSSQKTYSESPGDITLLHATGGSFDSSWAACTMIQFQPKGGPFPITGRIVGHLDSLSLDGKTYSDIIEARYGYEPGGVFTTTIPYMQVFYAKNEGPILIYQYANLAKMSTYSQKIYRKK